jgi:asparagine synthase (glutamine-hydrolysing)
VFGLLGRVYPKADWAPRALRAKTTFQALGRDAVEAYFRSVNVLRDETRTALYTRSFKARLAGYRALELFRQHAARVQADDPLPLVQYLDLHTYLPGDINVKVDRASMANSLEVREPLMDHPLVEWLATLPASLKVRGQEGKYLLKKAMEPHLPHDVMYRPKMGFAVPLARWFRGPLATRVRASLQGERLADTGVFNPAYLKRLVDEHQSGLRDHSAPIWTLLMFDGFLRNVLDRADAPALRQSA